MPAIPSKEVALDPRYSADPNGRLFRWEGAIHRAIPTERSEFCRSLFSRGIIGELVERGLLVDTTLTDWELEGSGAILRHKTVPFLSYPNEWCGAMLREAGLLILDLEIELSKHELSLQDGHPWNVLFNGTKPCYVDFGSIGPAAPDVLWVARDEFVRYLYYPLLLIQHGYGRIARALMADDRGVTLSEALPFVPDAPLVGNQLIQGSRRAGLESLRERIAAIEFVMPRTEWSDYYEGGVPSLTPSEAWNAKQRSVHQVLSGVEPTSVIDMGSNRGWYSRLAASLGHTVVALDVDEPCIGRLFEEAKQNREAILPLLMDVTHPTMAGYGMFCEQSEKAGARLRGSVAMALALLHHLVFKKGLRFEQMVEGLSLFAADRAVVEFVPKEDRFVREWWTPRYSWYTLDGLISALQKKFRRVTTMPSAPEPRILVLCER